MADDEGEERVERRGRKKKAPIEVVNANDNGSGSLRAALEDPFPTIADPTHAINENAFRIDRALREELVLIDINIARLQRAKESIQGVLDYIANDMKPQET